MGALWESTLQYALYLTQDADHAKDIAQSAFTRLWQARRSLSSSASVRVWLLRTSRNLVVNDHRRAKVSTKWLNQEADEFQETPPTPLEVAESRELKSAIELAVSHLPPRRRECFRLCHLQGLTYREAAEVMGIRPQSVANYLQAAIADLRVALAPFYHISRVPDEDETNQRSPRLSG
jgi:RNA polymerase sigma factor (sigma-70 family)